MHACAENKWSMWWHTDEKTRGRGGTEDKRNVWSLQSTWGTYHNHVGDSIPVVAHRSESARGGPILLRAAWGRGDGGLGHERHKKCKREGGGDTISHTHAPFCTRGAVSTKGPPCHERVEGGGGHVANNRVVHDSQRKR
jgi:hypothetical protein